MNKIIAPAAGRRAGSLPRMTLGQPQVVLTSPSGENRWGFYQFPDLWRAPSGDIYLAINVGNDSEYGEHLPSVFFVSRDKISCGNLGEVVTGPDRFLLAYSDFQHRSDSGEVCKAVMVRDVIVEPGR